MEENNENEEKKKDFSSELNENKDFDTEKYAAEQEKYRQMMPDYSVSDEPYFWRIGFGRRLGAYIIDFLLLSLIMLVGMQVTGILDEVMSSFGGIDFESDSANLFLAINELAEFSQTKILPFTLAINAVFYATEIFFAATPGKMLLGIIIGTDNKKTAPISQLFVRFAVKNCSLLFNFLFFVTTITTFSSLSSLGNLIIFFGCFAVLATKKQALHDTIAKTAIYFKDELKQF